MEKKKFKWNEIDHIKIITTDDGPFLLDFWIGLFGKTKMCRLPQGAKDYDSVYEIISKNENFNFENVIAASTSTDNNEFLVWKRIQLEQASACAYTFPASAGMTKRTS